MRCRTSLGPAGLPHFADSRPGRTQILRSVLQSQRDDLQDRRSPTPFAVTISGPIKRRLQDSHLWRTRPNALSALPQPQRILFEFWLGWLGFSRLFHRISEANAAISSSNEFLFMHSIHRYQVGTHPERLKGASLRLISIFVFLFVGMFRIARNDAFTMDGSHPDSEPPDEQSPLSLLPATLPAFPLSSPPACLQPHLIARGSAAGNITAASFTPMPSTTRSAGTASRNGAAEIPIIPASTGSPTLNPSSEIGKASASETGSATCRIL